MMVQREPTVQGDFGWAVQHWQTDRTVRKSNVEYVTVARWSPTTAFLLSLSGNVDVKSEKGEGIKHEEDVKRSFCRFATGLASASWFPTLRLKTTPEDPSSFCQSNINPAAAKAFGRSKTRRHRTESDE